MKKSPININYIIVIILIIVLGTKMYYLDRISNAGKELNETEREINILKLENESLSLELHDITSLKVLKSEAIESGYTDPIIIYQKNDQ